MRNHREYEICKSIAAYMRLKYPTVIFHFDLAGLNLSRAQAGMMKVVQGGRGWPDLQIAQQSFKGVYKGLYIEVKKEGTRIFNRKGEPSTEHIGEQLEMVRELEKRGYRAAICVGFLESADLIDQYLNS